MKPRLLAVDDEPDVLDSLEDLLGGEFDLVMARSAAEALEALGRDRGIALAIVDYMMPAGDGLTVVRAIREIGRDIPVVLYSAYMDTDSGEWSGGMRLKILSKSEPPDALLAAIRNLTGVAP